jgi:hypothetical protein
MAGNSVLIARRVDGFGHLELGVLPGQNLVISALASRGNWMIPSGKST